MVHWLHRPASAPGVPVSPPSSSRNVPAPIYEGGPPPRQFHEEDLTCSICRDILSDPIVLTETGRAYDAHCIRLWFLMGGKTCPMTGVRLESRETARAPDDLMRAAAAAAASTSGSGSGGGGGGDEGDNEGEWWTPVIAAMPGAAGQQQQQQQPSTSYSRGFGGGGTATTTGRNSNGNSNNTSSSHRGDHFRAVGANLRGIIKRKWIAARTKRTTTAMLEDGQSLGAAAAAAAVAAPARPATAGTLLPYPATSYFFPPPSAAAMAASAAARPKSAAPASGGVAERRWWFDELDQ